LSTSVQSQSERFAANKIESKQSKAKQSKAKQSGNTVPTHNAFVPVLALMCAGRGQKKCPTREAIGQKESAHAHETKLARNKSRMRLAPVDKLILDPGKSCAYRGLFF
jgi:hypothetical protein